jgi:hypothetical protein
MARTGEEATCALAHHEGGSLYIPEEAPPIRRIAAIVVLLAAPLSVGTAFAHDSGGYHMVTLAGAKTASRTASGSCTARTTDWGWNVTLHCASAKGHVSVRYDFTLEAGAGSVMYEVFTEGRTSKGFTRKTTHSGSHFSITATLEGANTHAEIRLVSIQYYTKH